MVRGLVYFGFIVAGVLLYSQALDMMVLPEMPGDYTWNSGTVHIHIPLVWSLGAVALTGIIIWAVKR